jgi:hypothetical protein
MRLAPAVLAAPGEGGRLMDPIGLIREPWMTHLA